MKGWRKILVAVVVVWVAAMSPRLIEAWHKKKDMDHVFSEFTKMPWPLNDGTMLMLSQETNSGQQPQHGSSLDRKKSLGPGSESFG